MKAKTKITGTNNQTEGTMKLRATKSSWTLTLAGIGYTEYFDGTGPEARERAVRLARIFRGHFDVKVESMNRKSITYIKVERS
jgi:hypothetical protein